MKADDFRTEAENQWCPGCPNFGIWAALRSALAVFGRPPEQICLVSGIGQAAKMPHYIKANFFNGLHGRALPVAQAVCAADPGLTVAVVTGDGDCYGEGGNHFLHAVRRNPDLTLIVHDNQIYGLTKGQASPTTDVGERTRLQFGGVESEPLKPLAIALMHGCGFIARGYAGDMPQLTDLIVGAFRHRGFSLIDVVQPCISWGTHTVDWYRERLYRLPPEYDPSDFRSASEKVLEWSERIPTGILYRSKESKACFGDRFRGGTGCGKLSDLEFPTEQAVSEILERFKV
jgi:2-oxoglutarate/2-oxoacid ferredoxin oxidoreductase subunit beta